MKIFTNYKSIAEHTKDSILLLGNFDGVHRGHQKIINSAKKIQSKKIKKLEYYYLILIQKFFLRKKKEIFYSLKLIKGVKS
jgi:riboflavin kinase/FMN adenylyltransferase